MQEPSGSRSKIEQAMISVGIRWDQVKDRLLPDGGAGSEIVSVSEVELNSEGRHVKGEDLQNYSMRV